MEAMKKDKGAKPTQSGWLHRIYRRVQARWVHFMQSLAVRLSRRGLTICLIGFLIFGITYNVLILTGYLAGSNIKVDAIQAPKYVEHPYELIEREIRASEAHELETLRKYLEDRQMTPREKQLYDSLAVESPTLLDNVTGKNSNQ